MCILFFNFIKRWVFILRDACTEGTALLKLVLEALMLLIPQIFLHWWPWRLKLKVRTVMLACTVKWRMAGLHLPFFLWIHVSCFRLQWSVREQDRIVALDSSDHWLFYIHYFSILTIDPFKYFYWYSIAKTSLRRWVEMGFIGCTLFLLVILAIIKLFSRFLQF